MCCPHRDSWRLCRCSVLYRPRRLHWSPACAGHHHWRSVCQESCAALGLRRTTWKKREEVWYYSRCWCFKYLQNMGCFIYRSKTVRTKKAEFWIWSQQTCTGPLICLTQYSCQKWWTPASQPVYVTSINSHTLPSGWDSMSAKRFPARGCEETACYGKHTPFSSFQPEVCMFGQASWETLNHLPDDWKTPAYFEWGRLDHNQLHPCHLSSQSYGWNQPPLPYFMAHQKKIPTLPSSLILLCYKNRSGALVLPTSALFRNSQNARRTAAPPPSTESCKKQGSPSRKSWHCKCKYQSLDINFWREWKTEVRQSSISPHIQTPPHAGAFTAEWVFERRGRLKANVRRWWSVSQGGSDRRNLMLLCCQESRWVMNHQQGQVKQACNLLGVLPLCYRLRNETTETWRALARRQTLACDTAGASSWHEDNEQLWGRAGRPHPLCVPAAQRVRGQESLVSVPAAIKVLSRQWEWEWEWEWETQGPWATRLQTRNWPQSSPKESDCFGSRGAPLWFQNEFARISVKGRKGDSDGWRHGKSFFKFTVVKNNEAMIKGRECYF